MQIHKGMTIFELLQSYPPAARVLKRYGLKCGECMAVLDESLEKGVLRHGLDLNSILEALHKELNIHVEPGKPFKPGGVTK